MEVRGLRSPSCPWLRVWALSARPVTPLPDRTHQSSTCEHAGQGAQGMNAVKIAVYAVLEYHGLTSVSLPGCSVRCFDAAAHHRLWRASDVKTLSPPVPARRKAHLDVVDYGVHSSHLRVLPDLFIWSISAMIVGEYRMHSP